VRAPDTRPEPGSSARAALASKASSQRGHFNRCARIARRKTRVNALVTLRLNRLVSARS